MSGWCCCRTHDRLSHSSVECCNRMQHSQQCLFFWPCRVQCSACSKWRILGFDAMQAVSAGAEWTCSQLGCTSCCLQCCTSSLATRARVAVRVTCCFAKHASAHVPRPHLLCRTLSCATVQSKREARGTRYVALGLEPDAALFEFGESAAATTIAVPDEAKALPSNRRQTAEQQQAVSVACCSAAAAMATQQHCTPLSLAAGMREIVGLTGLEAKPTSRAQLAADCAVSPGSLCQAAEAAAIASGRGGTATLPASGAAAERPSEQQPPMAANGPLHTTFTVAAAGWGAACTSAIMHA